MDTMNKKFEFRNILPEEVDQAVQIEQICFPPNEACSETMMRERVTKVPELFLVAVDRETGKIAGFLNGLSTEEELFRDEFFTDAGLYILREIMLCFWGLTFCLNTVDRDWQRKLCPYMRRGKGRKAGRS